ncbi:discoidin domain-containing protein, partial [Arenicella sp.]|nr:discoidin domain-containing protein [Arenicella sp.]
ASSGDYPRGYAVFVSDNGTNWGSAIATGSDSNSTTEITFNDVTASHIRIEQTGSTSRLWWSIHDLSVSLEDDTTVPPTDWTVSSMQELHDAVQRSNQDIVMRPGNYTIADLDEDDQYFRVSGDNNTIDLTGVYIEFPVHLAARVAHFRFEGEGNTLIGGTIENTYRSGITEVTDYVSYNQDRTYLARGGKPHMVIAGDDTTILGTKMIVRGSFPYGYGSYFGIGGNNTYGLSKRGGIQINSTNTILDGVELYMEAFSHGIYIGPGEGAVSDNTIIRNTRVEGIIRPTNEMLAEGVGGLMYLNDYRDNDGNPIPANDAESLSEDGIRTYPDAGSVFVEDSVVKGMRGGMRLYNASFASVKNSISIDNRLSNFQMSRDGEVESSTANFTYGPAIWVSNFKQNQDIDITLLPSPNAIGEHNIADIDREGNTIILRRSPGPLDSDEDRVILVSADNSDITNYTEYTIELESGTSGNNVTSAGRVIDNGSNNVTLIDLDL